MEVLIVTTQSLYIFFHIFVIQIYGNLKFNFFYCSLYALEYPKYYYSRRLLLRF